MVRKRHKCPEENNGTWHLVQAYNNKNGLNIEGKIQIEIEEKEAIFAANARIAQYFATQNVVQSVIANHGELLQAVTDLPKAYISAPRAVESILEYANFDLSRKFANTCSLFRSFLDHFDRYFSNFHGQESQEYQDWKDSLSREYDRSVAYRIVYMMRNYIQHYDMPPLNIGLTENTKLEGVASRVNVDLAKLCEDNKILNKLQSVGQSLPTAMSVVNIMQEFGQCFARIVNAANLVQARDVQSFCNKVINIRQEMGIDEEGRLAIIFLPYTEIKPATVNFKINWLFEHKASLILKILSDHEKQKEEGVLLENISETAIVETEQPSGDKPT